MFNWLQSLVTFRKYGGGMEVPELDPQGRIRVSMIPEAPIVVGTVAPTQTDGTVIWNNTSVGHEGLYFREQTRNKWLGDMARYSFGADSTDNANLRILGVRSAGNGSGHLILRDATIIAIHAHARGGQADKGFRVMINGSSVQAFALSTRNHSAEYNIDISSGDIMLVRSDSAGSASRDVVIDIHLRWRA